MHLLKALTKKNLEENYSLNENTVEVFTIDNVEYYLTSNMISEVKTIIFHFLESKINIEREKFAIAGGSVLTMFMYFSPLLIRDIDIFPETDKDFEMLKAKFSAKCPNFTETENAIQFKIDEIKFDLIKKSYNSISDLFDNFDFNVVKIGFDSKKTFSKRVSFENIFSFKIKNTREFDNNKTFEIYNRYIKYIKKGFEFSYKEMNTLFANIKANSKEEKDKILSECNNKHC